MKKPLLCIVIAALFSFNQLNAQNCSFFSQTVFIESTPQQVNGNCEFTFQLAFDVDINAGQKYMYIHFWKSTQYPNINYTSNAAPTSANGLATTLLNIGINNNGDAPVFISTYNADNSVILQHPGNNPAITIQKTPIPGGYRFIIKHVKVTISNALCATPLLFKGDAWSSNSAQGQIVHCATTNIFLAINDPAVSGQCVNSSSPRTYKFTISTVDPIPGGIQVTYNAYLDVNGNDLFDPADPVTNPGGDTLLSTSAAPIIITPATPYTSPELSYRSNLASFTKKVFVVVSVVGQSYKIGTEIIPCVSFLPITLRDFNASPTKGGAKLTWTTETEQNNAGFEIQRTDRDQGNFESIGNVPSKASGGNSSVALDYSFTDFINTKSKSFYYRLKQIDSDGNLSYSAIRKVLFNGSDRMFMLLPNPVVNGKANIIISQALGKIDLEVRNVQSALVKSISNSSEKNIQLYDLKPGIYFIRLTDKLNNTSHTEKLIVQ